MKLAAKSVQLAGFTVVEMIVVITLLAILSTVAISRLVGPSSFDPLLLRDYLVAQNAHARRIALNRQDASVQLVIDRTPSGVQSQVVADGIAIVDRVSATDAVITIGGTPFVLGDNLTINYDGTGYLVSASHGAALLNTKSGVEVSVSGLALCMYPSGVFSVGVCV